MNKIIISSMMLLFLTSCLPLKQTYGDFSDQGFTLSVEGKYASLSLNPANYPTKPIILSEESYAEDESGKRYPLIVNPEEYSEYRNSLNVKVDFLFLKASKNPMSKYKSWHNGYWTLYLKIKCGRERFEKHISFEVANLYYNPIIHGAPN
ncbi:MAG: hypothetical protein K8R79_02915 [Calditrichales bacterium]|nr:hypothetical protein [Calditrichales bacterium]